MFIVIDKGGVSLSDCEKCEDMKRLKEVANSRIKKSSDELTDVVINQIFVDLRCEYRKILEGLNGFGHHLNQLKTVLKNNSKGTGG